MKRDVFDDERRAWIAGHQGWSRIQTRRAQVLGRDIRRRVREQTGARPDPHEDTVLQPIYLRTGPSPAMCLEGVIVLVCAFAAPLGWLAGYGIYRGLVSWIPDRIISYPITALAWGSVAVGVPVMLAVPGPFSPLAVWLLVQLPAALLAGSVYGILQGWLAIPGSTDLWPHVPEDPPVELPELFGPSDITPPAVLEARTRARRAG